jgi:GntR family transcriptional regulator / MocR family aminotransferase
MPVRELILNLPPTSGHLYQRVAEAIQEAILDGRLKPGAYLPGTRALSATLGVNRHTVITALQILESEGWLTNSPFRGACVADRPPEGHPRAAAEATPAAPRIGFDLPSLLQAVSTTATGLFSLADGAPDPRLAPGELISKGYQRAMKRHGPTLLQNRHPQGTLLLREMLAQWISERQGVAVDPGRVLITRGSRSSLALLVYGFLRKGDLVAVETPGNRAAWDVFRAAPQVALRGLPLAGGGLDPDALQALVNRETVRLLYVTARRQFPTGGSLGGAQAERLVEVAQAHRLAILEDDYEGEFHELEPPPRSLLSLDPSGQVIQMGSLSRLVAPGLRISYLVAPGSLAGSLARIQQRLDEYGDAVLEWAMGDLIRDGELGRHLRRSRKVYQARRDHLASLLEARFHGALAPASPAGGMALWIQGTPGIDLEALVAAAKVRGLLLNPPSWFALEGAGTGFRLGFTQATEEEMDQAVARLGMAWDSLQEQGPGRIPSPQAPRS